MSLESKIEQLIEALNANTAALEGRVQTQLPLTPTPTDPSLTSKENADLEEAKKLDAELTKKKSLKKPEAPAAEVVPFVQPEPKAETKPETPAAPPEITADSIREIAHAIINARRAKKLEPATAPIIALNQEYGMGKISEAADSPKAGEVFAKLQAILKEVA